MQSLHDIRQRKGCGLFWFCSSAHVLYKQRELLCLTPFVQSKLSLSVGLWLPTRQYSSFQSAIDWTHSNSYVESSFILASVFTADFLIAQGDDLLHGPSIDTALHHFGEFPSPPFNNLGH